MDPYLQSDFSGGMNLFADDTGIGDNEYVIGINVRNRTACLEAISDAEQDSSAPTGLKQGLYAFDKYLVLFNNGLAYYKNIITDSSWTQIAVVSLDPKIARIYAEAVPQSVQNNPRKLIDATQINGTPLQPSVKITPELIPGSTGGLICQDGKNQPFIINSDGTARRLQTYQQWTLASREYVPIMRQMKFINGILIGVAPDLKTLYRSVSGRPLDFVVAVDLQGNKVATAQETSYSVGPFDVTCLAALNSGELFVGTLKTCHPITFNYAQTIYAEPTFLNTKTMAVGVANNFSFADVIGDYTFIDLDGLRSFNAVNSDQNEGRTSIFSIKLMKALQKRVNGVRMTIKQNVNTCCEIVFNNYTLYSITVVIDDVETPVVAVFDNARQVWTSFDILTLDGSIKQFAVADQSDNPTVYAITSTSVYKLYSSSTFAEAQIRGRAVTSGMISARLKANYLYACFESSDTDAIATAGIKVDNRAEVQMQLPTIGDLGIDVLTFSFLSTGMQGWKIQPVFRWQTDAVLNQIQMDFNTNTSKVDIKQAGRNYVAN